MKSLLLKTLEIQEKSNAKKKLFDKLGSPWRKAEIEWFYKAYRAFKERLGRWNCISIFGCSQSAGPDLHMRPYKRRNTHANEVVYRYRNISTVARSRLLNQIAKQNKHGKCECLLLSMCQLFFAYQMC